jgi:hypothetical protein
VTIGNAEFAGGDDTREMAFSKLLGCDCPPMAFFAAR